MSGIAVGLKKGFIVTKRVQKQLPSRRKGVSAQRDTGPASEPADAMMVMRCAAKCRPLRCSFVSVVHCFAVRAAAPSTHPPAPPPPARPAAIALRRSRRCSPLCVVHYRLHCTALRWFGRCVGARVQGLGERTKLVRGIVREVAGWAPYEKRIMEILKGGGNNPTKRAWRFAKKRLGTHIRAKRKVAEMDRVIAEVKKQESQAKAQAGKNERNQTRRRIDLQRSDGPTATDAANGQRRNARWT